MSAYNDSVAIYAHAKATMKANKASSHSSSHHSSSLASSADSMYSDSSSYFPVKDNATYKAPKTSKSSSLKNWTKTLVSDLGKSPTHRYDAAHGKDSKQYASYDNRPTKI
ncbi:hypothetical protein SEUCBS139899_001249 [Sporothrix eucalyptigena]|uniref:Uncharacterized protein n=1 Tax=Sporothrix eucalyptigena TaxID=1812306 RepID=A0ABP0BRT7_9PEZI